ncbi:DUF1223 domain-containing protein [uncultured Ferrimonas sp.]|uniref:DUF1223 domain-containing protein n=1 Tax=uncultured Ferrimonas sp. TaxID=432640 RepID=UPI0026244012|nr:DUF1223 domain-containing protein [uncultured Ferrimonas sp.]
MTADPEPANPCRSNVWPLQMLIVVAGLLLLGSALAQPPLNTQPLSQVRLHSSDEPAYLVELYTSQGCSSCPPAEQWLSRYAEEPLLWQRYFPLAYHVDYWDFIGWRDPFAQAQYTQRQQQLRRNGGSRGIYTPQFAVNGQEWRGWFAPEADKVLPMAIARQGQLSVQAGPQFLAEYRRVATGLAATVGKNTDGGRYQLHLALVGVGLSTNVDAGENRNRQLKHSFTVLAYQQSTPLVATEPWLEFTLPPFESPLTVEAQKFALVAWVTAAELPLQIAADWVSIEGEGVP